MIDIKKIKDIFPVLNLFIIGLGLAKIILYYNSFDINIIQYLEFSEVLILFFDDILKQFAFWFLPMIVLSIFIGHDAAMHNAKSYDDIINNTSFFKRAYLFMKHNWALLGLILISSFSKKQYVFGIVLMSVMYVMMELNHTLKKYYNTKLEATYHNVIGLSIILTFNVYRRTIDDTIETKNHKYSQTTIYLKDKTKIQDQKEIIFLGKTKNYTFFYDTLKKVSMIYPSSEIEKMYLKVDRSKIIL